MRLEDRASKADCFCQGLRPVRRNAMRHIFMKTSLLALTAALFVSGLPVITQHSSAASRAGADAQTRRGRRPAIQRRTTGTNTALVPVGTNLRVRLNNDLSSKDARIGDRFT